ncbi:MAG: hypothetical protein EZS28_008270 [Streblomastix strix]|uniref:Uncharacterized protein n=1 Tax=Streblomastix strix TaxID=222440 RepID=A0A5J4WNK5_9EUKA|nr:MAG: hypothetical protein EZS28_008270 [Streblomastix strix]
MTAIDDDLSSDGEESPQQVRALKCFICLRTAKGPVLTKCCTNIACSQCLRKWMHTSASCPHCRKRIGYADLIDVSRFVTGITEEIIPIVEAKKKKNEPCREHPQHTLDYYCANCKIVVCPDCAIVTSKHKGHDIQSMADIRRSSEGELVTSVVSIVERMKDIGTLERGMEREQGEIRQQYGSAFQLLEGNLKRLQTEMDSEMKKAVDNIEKYKEKLSRQSKNLKDEADEIQNTLKRECDQTIVERKKKMIEKAENAVKKSYSCEDGFFPLPQDYTRTTISYFNRDEYSIVSKLLLENLQNLFQGFKNKKSIIGNEERNRKWQRNLKQLDIVEKKDIEGKIISIKDNEKPEQNNQESINYHKNLLHRGEIVVKKNQQEQKEFSEIIERIFGQAKSITGNELNTDGIEKQNSKDVPSHGSEQSSSSSSSSSSQSQSYQSPSPFPPSIVSSPLYPPYSCFTFSFQNFLAQCPLNSPLLSPIFQLAPFPFKFRCQIFAREDGSSNPNGESQMFPIKDFVTGETKMMKEKTLGIFLELLEGYPNWIYEGAQDQDDLKKMNQKNEMNDIESDISSDDDIDEEDNEFDKDEKETQIEKDNKKDNDIHHTKEEEEEREREEIEIEKKLAQQFEDEDIAMELKEEDEEIQKEEENNGKDEKIKESDSNKEKINKQWRNQKYLDLLMRVNDAIKAKRNLLDQQEAINNIKASSQQSSSSKQQTTNQEIPPFVINPLFAKILEPAENSGPQPHLQDAHQKPLSSGQKPTHVFDWRIEILSQPHRMIDAKEDQNKNSNEKERDKDVDGRNDKHPTQSSSSQISQPHHQITTRANSGEPVPAFSFQQQQSSNTQLINIRSFSPPQTFSRGYTSKFQVGMPLGYRNFQNHQNMLRNRHVWTNDGAVHFRLGIRLPTYKDESEEHQRLLTSVMVAAQIAERRKLENEKKREEKKKKRIEMKKIEKEKQRIASRLSNNNKDDKNIDNNKDDEKQKRREERIMKIVIEMEERRNAREAQRDEYRQIRKKKREMIMIKQNRQLEKQNRGLSHDRNLKKDNKVEQPLRTSRDNQRDREKERDDYNPRTSRDCERNREREKEKEREIDRQRMKDKEKEIELEKEKEKERRKLQELEKERELRKREKEKDKDKERQRKSSGTPSQYPQQQKQPELCEMEEKSMISNEQLRQSRQLPLIHNQIIVKDYKEKKDNEEREKEKEIEVTGGDDVNTKIKMLQERQKEMERKWIKEKDKEKEKKKDNENERRRMIDLEREKIKEILKDNKKDLVNNVRQSEKIKEQERNNEGQSFNMNLAKVKNEDEYEYEEYDDEDETEAQSQVQHRKLNKEKDNKEREKKKEKEIISKNDGEEDIHWKQTEQEIAMLTELMRRQQYKSAVDTPMQEAPPAQDLKLQRNSSRLSVGTVQNISEQQINSKPGNVGVSATGSNSQISTAQQRLSGEHQRLMVQMLMNLQHQQKQDEEDEDDELEDGELEGDDEPLEKQNLTYDMGEIGHERK